jgi:hypothetical protein
MDPIRALKEYRTQHGNCRARQIPFELTFDEWCAWWSSTGRYDQRGRDPDQYVMVRLDASGAFRTDNIACVTLREAGEQFWTSSRRSQALQHNQSISQANRRPVRTPLGQWPSLQSAAAAHGMSESGLRWRIQHHPDQYQYST